MSVRTFLAIELNDSTRSRLCQVQQRLDTEAAKIKWVDKPQLHITLKFLGSIEEEVLPEVCNITTQIAGKIQPFDFDVVGVTAFPLRGPVRMFWAHAVDATGRMAVLYEKLEASFREVGFKAENRSFKPHITLGRIRYTKKPELLRDSAQQFESENFGTLHTDEVVVFCSRLTPSGPIYTPAVRAGLGKK